MRITLRLALDDYFEEKISLASFAAFHFSGHLVRPGAFLVVTDALDPSKKRVAEIKKIARLIAGGLRDSWLYVKPYSSVEQYADLISTIFQRELVHLHSTNISI